MKMSPTVTTRTVVLLLLVTVLNSFCTCQVSPTPFESLRPQITSTTSPPSSRNDESSSFTTTTTDSNMSDSNRSSSSSRINIRNTSFASYNSRSSGKNVEIPISIIIGSSTHDLTPSTHSLNTNPTNRRISYTENETALKSTNSYTNSNTNTTSPFIRPTEIIPFSTPWIISTSISKSAAPTTTITIATYSATTATSKSKDNIDPSSNIRKEAAKSSEPKNKNPLPVLTNVRRQIGNSSRNPISTLHKKLAGQGAAKAPGERGQGLNVTDGFPAIATPKPIFVKLPSLEEEIRNTNKGNPSSSSDVGTTSSNSSIILTRINATAKKPDVSSGTVPNRSTRIYRNDMEITRKDTTTSWNIPHKDQPEYKVIKSSNSDSYNNSIMSSKASNRIPSSITSSSLITSEDASVSIKSGVTGSIQLDDDTQYPLSRSSPTINPVQNDDTLYNNSDINAKIVILPRGNDHLKDKAIPCRHIIVNVNRPGLLNPQEYHPSVFDSMGNVERKMDHSSTKADTEDEFGNHDSVSNTFGVSPLDFYSRIEYADGDDDVDIGGSTSNNQESVSVDRDKSLWSLVQESQCIANCLRTLSTSHLSSSNSINILYKFNKYNKSQMKKVEQQQNVNGIPSTKTSSYIPNSGDVGNNIYREKSPTVSMGQFHDKMLSTCRKSCRLKLSTNRSTKEYQQPAKNYQGPITTANVSMESNKRHVVEEGEKAIPIPSPIPSTGKPHPKEIDASKLEKVQDFKNIQQDPEKVQQTLLQLQQTPKLPKNSSGLEVIRSDTGAFYLQWPNVQLWKPKEKLPTAIVYVILIHYDAGGKVTKESNNSEFISHWKLIEQTVAQQAKISLVEKVCPSRNIITNCGDQHHQVLVKVLAISFSRVEKLFSDHLSCCCQESIDDERRSEDFSEAEIKGSTITGIELKRVSNDVENQHKATIAGIAVITGKGKKFLVEAKRHEANTHRYLPLGNPNHVNSMKKTVEKVKEIGGNASIDQALLELSEINPAWGLRVVSMVNRNFLVVTELAWEFPPRGNGSLILNNDNLTMASMSNYVPEGEGVVPKYNFLLTWEIFGGGLKGNLVTDTTSGTISLWPDTAYFIQVGLIKSLESSEVKVQLANDEGNYRNSNASNTNTPTSDKPSGMESIIFPLSEEEPTVLVKSERLFLNTSQLLIHVPNQPLPGADLTSTRMSTSKSSSLSTSSAHLPSTQSSNNNLSSTNIGSGSGGGGGDTKSNNPLLPEGSQSSSIPLNDVSSIIIPRTGVPTTKLLTSATTNSQTFPSRSNSYLKTSSISSSGSSAVSRNVNEGDVRSDDIDHRKKGKGVWSRANNDNYYYNNYLIGPQFLADGPHKKVFQSSPDGVNLRKDSSASRQNQLSSESSSTYSSSSSYEQEKVEPGLKDKEHPQNSSSNSNIHDNKTNDNLPSGKSHKKKKADHEHDRSYSGFGVDVYQSLFALNSIGTEDEGSSGGSGDGKGPTVAYCIFVLVIVACVIFVFVVAFIGFFVVTSSISRTAQYFVPKRIRVWIVGERELLPGCDGEGEDDDNIMGEDDFEARGHQAQFYRSEEARLQLAMNPQRQQPRLIFEPEQKNKSGGRRGRNTDYNSRWDSADDEDDDDDGGMESFNQRA